jgi:Protein of unknown function (DUF3617)
MRHRWTRGVGIASACTALATGVSAGPMQPGLWEVLSSANVGGATTDSPATRVCVSSKDAADGAQGLPRPTAACSVANARTEGNKTSYDIECTDKPAMRGHAELMATPNAYEGSMQLTITQAPGTPGLPMSMTFAGRRLGDC